MERLVTQTPCEVTLVREGVLGPELGGREADELRRRVAQGETVVLRQPDRFDFGLQGLGKSFVDALGGELNLHVYATPAGSRGFDWHCDCEEVFILQTSGSKAYALRENTVWPAPIRGALPTARLFARETSPEERVELSAGDWLYLPAGHWHRATACDEEAISISVGIHAPGPLDLLLEAHGELARDPRWRRRWGAPAETPEHLRAERERIDALLAEVQRLLTAESEMPPKP